MHRPAQQALNARIVGELEKPAHHLQQMLADDGFEDNYTIVTEKHT